MGRGYQAGIQYVHCGPNPVLQYLVLKGKVRCSWVGLHELVASRVGPCGSLEAACSKGRVAILDIDTGCGTWSKCGVLRKVCGEKNRTDSGLDLGERNCNETMHYPFGLINLLIFFFLFSFNNWSY